MLETIIVIGVIIGLRQLIASAIGLFTHPHIIRKDDVMEFEPLVSNEREEFGTLTVRNDTQKEVIRLIFVLALGLLLGRVEMELLQVLNSAATWIMIILFSAYEFSRSLYVLTWKAVVDDSEVRLRSLFGEQETIRLCKVSRAVVDFKHDKLTLYEVERKALVVNLRRIEGINGYVFMRIIAGVVADTKVIPDIRRFATSELVTAVKLFAVMLGSAIFVSALSEEFIAVWGGLHTVWDYVTIAVLYLFPIALSLFSYRQYCKWNRMK